MGLLRVPLTLDYRYNQLHIVEFLLQNGADVNAADRGGLIPLHNASSYGHIAVAEILIAHKANVNARDKWKFTPLHEAAQKGRTQLCALLISHGADVNIRTQVCLYYSQGLATMLSAEAMCMAKDGRTALHLASAEDVRALLRDLVDVTLPASTLCVHRLKNRGTFSSCIRLLLVVPLHHGERADFYASIQECHLAVGSLH